MNNATAHIETEKRSAERSRSKLVPALRFKEFEDKWNSSRMLEVASKITDGTHDTPKKIDEGIPYLTAVHVKDGNIDFESCYYLSQKDHDIIYKRCNPEYGDLLIVNIGAGTATCASVTVDYQFSLKNVALVKPNRKIIEPDYLIHLQRKKSKRLFHQLTSGGAQPFFSLKQIGKLKVEFPTLPEQQKIASFLSAVDEKIQQLTKKKALLEHYKKGVMQQLFRSTGSGHASGQLRFKDENGKDYPDWEEKQLSDVAKRVVRKNKENNLNVLTISAQQGLISQLEYFNKSVSAKNVTNYYLLHRDDFAYNKSYSTGYPMGAIKRLNRYDKGVVSTLYICFEFNDKVSLNFMEQYFEFGRQNIELEKVAQEGARNHGLLNIGVNDFLNIDIKVPTLPEQQKIAGYLSRIDTKIESVNHQITQTQTFKKGLLQQMFV